MKKQAAAAIVLVLALGTGGALGLFSLLDALAFRQLPLPRPEELVAAKPVDPTTDAVGLAYPRAAFDAMAATPDLFASVAGVADEWLLAGAPGSDTRWLVRADGVTEHFFDTLGVTTRLGRLMTTAEIAGAVPVAVVSDQFWRRHLGGSSEAIGSTITLQGVKLTIVGVTPASYRGLEVDQPTDVTVPLGLTAALTHSPHPSDDLSVVWLVGRRRPGVSNAQVDAALQARWTAIVRPAIPTWLDPDMRKAFETSRLDVRSAALGVALETREEYRRVLVLLVIAAVVALGLACLNASTLLLAQSAAREREWGIRVALGASRGQLVRLVFLQALRLSMLGTAGGLLVAVFAARALTSMLWLYSDSAPFDFTPDLHVVLAVLVTTVAAACVAVVLPALRATRPDLSRSVRASSGGSARTRRWGHRLLVAQVTVATVLVVAGWVVTANIQHLSSRPGFAIDGVMVLSLDQRPDAYPEHFDVAGYNRRLAETVATIHGVRAVGLLAGSVLSGSDHTWRLHVSAPRAGQSDPFQLLVSPGALATLDVRLVQGRDFRWTDDGAHPRVAVASASLAHTLFADGNAIGRRVHVGDQADGFEAEIVGVTDNARLVDLRAASPAILYTPIAQEGDRAGVSLDVVVRAVTPLATVAADVRSTVQAMGQDDVANVASMSDILNQALVRERLVAIGGLYFAVLAGLIMAVGLSGLLAYSVSSRTREMGIRSAIGASVRSIRLLVVCEAMTTVGLGLALGLTVAGWLTRAAALSPIPLGSFSALAFSGAALLVLVVGLAAAWLPARRATRISPLTALRSE